MPEEVKDYLKHQFTAVNVPISVNEDGEKKRRTFDAEVYSGGRIDNHYYWGRSGVVIDLQGLQLKSKIGLVEEHFGGKRVGVATSYEVNTKFSAKGHFLSNPKAKEIVQDIDEEYPFQMSWWADPESIEEIAPGKTVFVNGQEFTGPIHIFRNVRVHEITICGVGADTQTSVQAFSGKTNPSEPQPEETDVTELEKAQAEIATLKLKNTELETQNKQFAAAKREAEITALGKDLGKEFSAEDITEMKALDESTFAFSAKQLRQFSVTKPPEQKTPGTNPALAHLFSHQATGDQGGQQGQGGGQGSALDQAFAKFTAAQEVK